MKWAGLSCNYCGHWEKGRFTKTQIADWLRIHAEARITPNPEHLTTKSICPAPCGMP